MEWAPGTGVNTPCDEWEGTFTGRGYPHLWVSGRYFYVHRLVWMQDHGHTDLDILHLCDNPACINIDHLRAGSHSDNMQDMAAKGRHNMARKTVCKNGHPLEGENVYRIPSGGRACRKCRKAAELAYRERVRRERIGRPSHYL